jgi:hypothetical protein
MHNLLPSKTIFFGVLLSPVQIGQALLAGSDQFHHLEIAELIQGLSPMHN